MTVHDDDGRLVAIVDRTGVTHARLTWTDGKLVELRVPGAVVHGAIIDDPLLGSAHEIADEVGKVLTTMSAIDWARPTEIPAIAAPGALPLGAGGAIMNVLAILAQRAGIEGLRYAGPYPTSALFSTLARSFRTETTEDDFTSAFADRAARVARDPMPAVFVPAPHERIALAARGIVELRDGIERATIDGVTYARGGSITRLVDDHGHVRAEVWFADARYAHAATIALDGALVDGPHPMPACTDDIVGTLFTPALATALAELVADAVPSPLADAARKIVEGHAIRWADLGARASALVGDELHVHAALWRIAPRGMARLAMALVEALVPIVTLHAVKLMSR